MSLRFFILFVLIELSFEENIAKKVCFAYEDDDVADVLIDITSALFNSTGVINENENEVEPIKFSINTDQDTLDAFIKLGETKKCNIVFTKFKKIRSNLTAVVELNDILNRYNMYAVNTVLGTIPLCYNRFIRGYLTCDSSFNYMNFYWRNYTNFVLIYSDKSDMKGCVDSYTKYWSKNEMNVTRIIKYEETDNKWKSLLNEFKDEKAILINFLPIIQAKSVAEYIATPSDELNITMISFQEISYSDISQFPTHTHDKFKFYVASQIISLDITKNTDFKTSYENIINSRGTTAPPTTPAPTTPAPTPTSSPPSTPSPSPTTAAPTVAPVEISDFTTDEKIYYELLSLYLNEIKLKKIVTPEMVISSLYNEIRTVNGVKYSLLTNNNLVGTVDGYEIVYDAVETKHKLADEPFRVLPISFEIQEKELNGEPLEELCDFSVSKDYYKSTYQYIITVSYLSGAFRKLIEGIDVTFEAALDKINKEERILGKKTLSIYIDASEGFTFVMNEIKKYNEKLNIIAVLYYGLDDVLNAMIKAWTYEIPIINYSITAGEHCNSKVLEMGVNIQTLWQSTTELFDIDTMMIVYSDSDYSNTARDIVSANAQEKGIYLKEDAFIEENTVEASKNACGQISSKCTDGCYVINVLDRSYYTNFFTECFKDYNISSSKFPIISYAFDEQLLKSIDENAVNGHFVVGYFFDSMKTEVGEELRNALREKNFFGPVTPNMAVLYSTTFIIARAFNKARRSDELRAFLLGARNSYYNGPGGHCYVGQFGYVSYLFHSGVIRSGSIIELDTSKGTQIATAFYDPSEYCNWVDGKLEHLKTKEVVFLYVRNETNSERIDYYEYTANQVGKFLNSKGGIAGYMLKVRVSPLNSIEELVNCVKNEDPKKVLCYIGTTTEERNAIKPLLAEQDKLLFSIHISEGEECDKQVIQMGRIPHQYVFSLFGYFTARQPLCAIISDNSTTNIDIAKYLSEVSQSFSSYSCWIIQFENFTRLEYQLKLMTNFSSSTTLYTLLGSLTNELMDRAADWDFLSPEKYPFVILDFLYPQYYRFENKTKYEGNYYVSSYSLYRTNKENLQMKSIIELYYGNLPVQMHEDSVAAFTALSLVSSAMGNIYIDSSAELRYKIYKTSMFTPYGEISVSTSNLMKTYFAIHKFTNETDELLILPDHSLERSQFSAFLNNNINNVCDFDEGVNVNFYEKEVYKFAIWYEDEDESLYFLLREYQDITNEEGGFGGLNYDLVKTFCKNDTEIEKSFNQSYRFIISGCSDEVNNKYIGRLNKTFMFIMKDQQTPACNDSAIYLGLSPYQQAYPLINYLSTVYSLKAFVIMNDNYNNSILHDIIIEYLRESGYETPIDVFINETDSEAVVDSQLYGVLSRILRYMKDGGIIFNYLDKYSTKLYKILNDILCYSKNYESVAECSNSASVYSNKYVIVTDNNEAFNSVNSSLRIGHLLLVSSYVNSAPYIERLWNDLFGENQMPTSLQARGVLGYEIMKEILSNTLSDDYETVREYMLNNNIVTSYGTLVIDKDFHLHVQISIMTSDENGNIVEVSKLSSYFPAETFYLTSESTTEQYVCNFKDQGEGEIIQKIFTVVIFGPLSNADAYVGNEIMYSLLSCFDMINEKGGIKERFVNPLVIDSTDDIIVYETVRIMKQKYHTRIAFGCYDSFTRNGIADDLSQNGIILFYPHNFEGFECKENIIYCGMPFSLRTAYIPWILSTFDKTKIAILYTNKDTETTIMQHIKSELNVRSVTPIAVIELPNTDYNMRKVLQLLQSKMNSGVILSLLTGNARFELFKIMNELGMTSDLYTVVADKVRRVDIDGEYGKYMIGHYIWVSFHKDYYPLTELRELFNREYSFAVNTTHGNENAFLAAKIFENAFSNVEFNDSEALDVPYTFTEALDAIHNAVIVEGDRNVKVFTNNYMSFSISLCQIIKNTTTGYLDADAIYEYHSSDITAPNPWKTSDPSFPRLSCNWDTKAAVRGEKLKEDSYVIGAIFAIKNSEFPYEMYAFNLLIAMTSKINDLGGVVGKSLSFKLFDTSSYNGDYERLAKTVAADEEISVFFGCYSSICRTTVGKELMKVNKYLFYPQTYEGQECYPSVYYFGAIPNQIFDQFVPYLRAISKYNEVLLIGSSDNEPEYSDAIFAVVKYKLEDIMDVIGEYRINSKSGSARAIVSSVLSDLPNGGIIVTSLVGNSLDELLIALNEKILTKHQIQILCIGSDRDLLDLPIDDYIDVYIPGYYFDEVNETNAFRLAAVEYTVKDVNSAYESSVYAGMRFWYRAVLKANSLETEDWKNAIMGMEYETGSGILRLNKNQYASLPFYLGQVNTAKKRFDIVYSQDILIEPMAWNWDIAETHGKMCDQTIGKSQYEIDIINILFGISLTGIQQSMDTGLSNVMNMLVDEFNINGGIIGHRLYVTDIDIGSDETECSTVFKKNFDSDVNNTINLIVTTASIECMTMILDEVEKRDIVIVHIGMSPGESCENNIIYANKEPSIVERVVYVLNDVTDENTLAYAILSTYDEASSRANQYAQKVVNNLGGTIVLTKTFTSTISQQEVDIVMTTIVERSTKGCFVLLFGSDNLHKYVDKSYSNNNIDGEKYKIISYNTGESMNGPDYQPFYSIQSYFQSIDSDSNKVFVNRVLKYSKNPITERMSSLYAVFHLWTEAVIKMNSVIYSKYQQALYTVSFDAPEGNVKIDTNNYMNHYIRFGYHRKGANDFDKVYESSSPVSSNPWKTEMNDGYYICDFSSSTIGRYSRQSTVTIGLLISFSGELASTDRIILNGLKAAVKELNNAGGVLDRMILMQIRDCKSDLQNYITFATEFGRLTEIVAIFGGSRYSHQLAVADIAIKYDILYFYPAMSGGEFCSANTFSFGITGSQMISVIKKYVTMRVENLIMIYDPTDFSINITWSLINHAEQIKMKTYPFFYHNITDILSIPEPIRKKSAIILFVSINYVVETVNNLCEMGIYPDNGYGMFSVTMEQLHAKEITPKCLNNYKMLATFTNDMGSTTADDVTKQDSAVTFVTAMNDLYNEGSWFTQHLESAYTSVKVWAEAAKTSFSFDSDKVRNALYGLSTTTPAGLLVVNPNGFTNRVVYGFQVAGDGKTRVTSYASQPEIAEAYNQLIKGNEEYICDFTDQGERFKYDSIKIALFHDGSAAAHERELRILTLEEYLIREINNNKLNGYYVQPIIIFGTTSQDFIDEIKKIENDTSIVLFMGCRGDPCRETVYAEAERLNKFFVYTGISEGYMSSKNMLVTGNTAYQKLRASVTYMLNQGVENFLLILSDDPKMKKYLSTAQYILKVEEKYSKVNYITVESNRTESSYYTSIASQISSSKIVNGRLCLLYFLDGTSSRMTLQAMKDYGINFHEIIAILVRYTRSDYSDGFLTGMPGSLITVSYSSSLTTALSEAFVSDVQENLGNTAETLQEMEYIKVGFDIWKSAMIQAAVDSGSKIPPIEYLRSCIIGQDVKAPSGSVYVEENLHLQRNIFIMEGNANGDYLQVYPDTGQSILIEPRPYPEGLPEYAKFGKSKGLFEYSTSIVAVCYLMMGIGIAFSLFALIFTIVKQKKQVIRAFGRSYSYVLAFHLLFCSFSVLTYIIPPSKTNGICKARVAVVGIAFKGMLGLFYAKVTKIYQKYVRTHKIIVKSRVTTARILLFYIGFIVLGLLVVMVWFLADMPEYEPVETVKYSTYFVDVSIRQCSVSTPLLVVELVIDGLLLLFLIYLTGKTKNAANQQNDSIGMFISTLILTLLGAVMVALDFSISSEPDSILLIRTLGTELIIILMVLLQYGIKLLNLYMDESANLSTESGSKHMGTNGHLGTATGMHTSTSISKMPNSSLLSQSAFLSSKMTHTHTTKTLRTQPKH